MTDQKTQRMPTGWKQKSLNEIIEKVVDNRGKTPPFNFENGYRMIETYQLNMNSKFPSFERNKQKYVDEDTYKTWFRAGHPQDSDILFSTVGESVPQFCFSPNDEKVCIAQNLIGLRPNKSVVDSFFLLSYFKQNSFIREVKNRLIITAQPSIKVPHLLSIEILLPPLPEQRAIADVLSAFDDKIELLREQNKTLEAIAQTLFNRWFVEFNFPDENGQPYYDSGGKMIDSELGDIPEGWRVDKLGDYIEIRGGSTPSTSNPDFWDGDINWTSPKDLSNSRQVFLLNTEKKITEEGLNQISSGLLPKYTLLLSSRAPIGYLAITSIETSINQGYIAFLPNAYLSNYFMYLWLNRNMSIVEGSANGSTFLEISKSSFRDIENIIPKEETLQKFNLIVDPIFVKIQSNLCQIQTLSQLRDSILPKLMRGEVRVKGF